MTEHQEREQQLQAEADQLEERNERLDEHIDEARGKVERIREDDSYPSAETPKDGLPPEANFTTSGDQPPEGPGDDA